MGRVRHKQSVVLGSANTGNPGEPSKNQLAKSNMIQLLLITPLIGSLLLLLIQENTIENKDKIKYIALSKYLKNINTLYIKEDNELKLETIELLFENLSENVKINILNNSICVRIAPLSNNFKSI